MSLVRVSKVKMTEGDMQYVIEAGKALGLEYNQNKKNYRRWGGSQDGVYETPEHVCIGVFERTDKPDAYEVGVLRSKKDGSLALAADLDAHFCRGLDNIVGANFSNFTLEFTKAKTLDAFAKDGFTLNRVVEKGKDYVTVSMSKNQAFGSSSSSGLGNTF